MSPARARAATDVELARPVRGATAVRLPGDRLDEAAARNDLSGAELTELLTTDRSAWLDLDGVVFFKDEMATAPMEDPVAAQAPLDQTFLLHSKPGSTRTIFLDFDGGSASGTGWHAAHPATPNTQQRTRQRRSCRGTLRGPRGVRARTCSPMATATDSRPGSSPRSSNSPKNIAEAVSHEVGHNLGLNHDGTATLGYYEGRGSWAPIMGVGYFRAVTQWSKGDYVGATNIEDDVPVIRGVAGTRSDEAPTSIVAAPAVPGGTAYVTSRTDVDTFLLGTCTGAVTVAVNALDSWANLDISMSVLDATGQTVATDAPLGLGATLTPTLATGTYYVSVDGVGNGAWSSNGYDDYGSLGTYTLAATGGNGAAPSGTPSAPAGATATPHASDGLCPHPQRQRRPDPGRAEHDVVRLDGAGLLHGLLLHRHRPRRTRAGGHGDCRYDDGGGRLEAHCPAQRHRQLGRRQPTSSTQLAPTSSAVGVPGTPAAVPVRDGVVTGLGGIGGTHVLEVIAEHSRSGAST